MAPTHSKPQPLLRTHQLVTRKCILATSLANPNNVDTAAIKHCKLEEAAAHQPSIETVEDDEDNPTMLNRPQKARSVLEAADGSDDDKTNEFDRGGSSVGDVSMLGSTEEGGSVDGNEEDSDDEQIELGK